MDNKILGEIAQEIYSYIELAEGDSFDIIDLCERHFTDKYPSAVDIEEPVFKLVDKVSNIIKRQIEHCKKQAIEPDYVFSSHSDTVLVRFRSDDEEPKYVLSLRKERKKIFGIIKGIEWRDFEKLCIYLLKINKLNDVSLTKVNEEGVDFVGIFELGKYVDSRVIPDNYKVKIVGQVKHKKKKVNPAMLRAFETYVKEYSRPDEELAKRLPYWFTEVDLPIFGIYYTTSDYTRSAKNYARREWLIHRNGEQIVEDLIKSESSKEWLKPKNGDFVFDESTFTKAFMGIAS